MNREAMRPEVRDEYERALAHARGDDDAFANRFARFFTELRDPLVTLYGDRFPWRELLTAIATAAEERDPALRRLDHQREITPDWLLREQAIGYVAYADRFAGTLDGVRSRIPYLRELGITYLHLMPLLKSRPAPNDGGYAVVDYGAVEPALGTMDDLRALARDLHHAGMALCVDVVLNHTAREHPWTRERPDFYRTFEDRAEPDAYEATLPDVFPDTAPGNFTYDEQLGRWVWTTFNPYQWDLDYTNPDVFVAMVKVMLELANAGVDVLRLDAVPFMWKRLGTDSQNQPEVHELLQAFRAAMRIAAPAVAFKAEAIVAPAELIRYLGEGRHEGKECDLAYNNAFMAVLWSGLATRRATLMTRALSHLPAPPIGAGWVTYVRCHDDIGWAITDEDVAATGEDGTAHRAFLAAFYAGDFPGSFARGARFEGDRTSGSAASLAGLEGARDLIEADLAVRRVLLLYAIAFAYGGLPLIYMGDELGLLNDRAHLDDADNRWIHRPHMDWAAAERRADPESVEGRLFGGLKRLVALRTRTRAVHSQGRREPVSTGNDHVFGLLRERAGQTLLFLANMSEEPQAVASGVVRDRGLVPGDDVHERDGAIILAAYEVLWITSG